MRTVSMKSLCLLCGFLVPCLGTAAPTQAGVIPWLYDSIFGYGWGGSGYGGGYGGGMPYSAGYNGGYGSGMSYSPVYSAPAYSAPMMSSPAAPADGFYQSHYGPSLGYYDGGYSSGYVADSSCCCTPCSSGDCATSIQSGKPEPAPTPADEALPVPTKVNPALPKDDHGPAGGTGARGRVPPSEEALPTSRPPRPMGGVGDPTDLKEPKEYEPGADPEPGTQLNFQPGDRSIAVRYTPIPKRSRVVIPQSASRVVRIDRTVREQPVHVLPKPQLASNP